MSDRLDFALWLVEYLLIFVGIFAAMFAIGSFIERYFWARPLIKNNSRANDKGDGLELQTLMAANLKNGWSRARLADDERRQREMDEREMSWVRMDRPRQTTRTRH